MNNKRLCKEYRGQCWKQTSLASDKNEGDYEKQPEDI